jgi:hypothetical protein
MPLRTFFAWCVFFAFFTASVPAQVAGQRRQPPKQQRPKQNQKPPATQPVTLEGTLQAVASNQLEVLAEAPARDKRRRADKNAPVGKWTVAIPLGTTLVVLGEAKPDYLRAGQTVEFTGDPANMDVNRLSDLTVLAPVRKSKPAGGAKAAAKGEEAGFADPNRITGRLDKQQGNKWSVRMGAKTVEIEVADNAKITVMLANAKLVSVGDRVIVRGEGAQDNRRGFGDS